MEEIEFEATLKEYLNYKKLFVRNNTYESYERRINLYVVPYFKDKYVNNIKKSDIIDWQRSLFDDQVSCLYK